MTEVKFIGQGVPQKKKKGVQGVDKCPIASGNLKGEG